MNAFPTTTRQARSGFTVLEAVVAVALLTVALGSVPASLTALRRMDDRIAERQFALHELANLHERIDAGERAELRPEAIAALRDAELATSDTPIGGRWLRRDLTLSWGAGERQSAPLSRLVDAGGDE